MDKQLRQQQQAYDLTWEAGLKSGKEQRGNFTVNMEFLKSQEILKEGMSVLELGCGIGSIVNEMSELGCDAVGTDISNKAIEYGQKKYPGINLMVGVGEKLDFEDDSFDVVMSFDVFEHIKEIDEHLTEVSRVLTDGGCYLLQTPNKYFNSVFETVKTRSFSWRKYHPSLHSKWQLRKRFLKHGFEVRFVKMNVINEFTLSKLKNPLLCSILKRVDFARLPICMQINFYVVAKKL